MADNPADKPTVTLNVPQGKELSHVAIDENAENYDEQLDEKEEKKPFVIVKLLKSIISFFFDFLETIVVALSVFVVIYLFIIQPHEVKGSSMEPNFHNNEYIITDKISYRFSNPERGQVIIFKAPVNPDVDYIKRIIGLPGDKVKVIKGKVYVNDKMLDEFYLASETPIFPGGFMQESVEIVVPEGHFFVMGDNRPHSSDSREFGPIAKKLIIGRAIFRYWPISELGAVAKINYRLN